MGSQECILGHRPVGGGFRVGGRTPREGEGKGGGWVARKYPDRVAMMEVLDACELMDADTPEALNRLLQKNDLP